MTTTIQLMLTVLAVCGHLFSVLGGETNPQGGPRRGYSPSNFPQFSLFDPGQGEFPEGVAVDKVGNVYVSIGGVSGPRGAVLRVTPSMEKTVLVDFGTPGANGLAVDANGDVYVARSIAPNNGVYRVDRQGRAVRLPGTERMVMPNALAFDKAGNLYVTETFSLDLPLTSFANGSSFGAGGIWRIPRCGAAELWLRHELLTGLGPTLFPFPVGANGIAMHHGDLYVINTDKALVVRLPVLGNGKPGQPEVWKHVMDVPESVLFESTSIPLMLDGLALDVLGNLYIAVPSRAAIVRINAGDRSQETIAAYPVSSLDAPLSLAFGTGRGERQSLFISNGGLGGMIVPSLPWAGPGLVKIPVGIPGLPLP